MVCIHLLQSIFDHCRYQSSQVGTWELEARIGIDFDHPHVHVFVNHKIIPKYFEWVALTARVYLARYSSHWVLCHLLHLGHHFLGELTFDVLTVKILLELRVTELVTRLKLTIVIQLLLYSVVGEMHISVRDILEREFSTTGSEIALWVPIALQISIDTAHHCEAPDIKLTILVEQWLFNVLLNDVGPSITIYISVLNQTFDVI